MSSWEASEAKPRLVVGSFQYSLDFLLRMENDPPSPREVPLPVFPGVGKVYSGSTQ